jgi:hypothetical protein
LEPSYPNNGKPRSLHRRVSSAINHPLYFAHALPAKKLLVDGELDLELSTEGVNDRSSVEFDGKQRA